METVGDLMRDWRKRRRMSQLDLSLEADVSARHVNFIESGRSGASRVMLQRLGARLAMPLRDRNRLLVAGGYAPDYDERPLDAPDMQATMSIIRVVLEGHCPYPALAVDRQWNLLAANQAAEGLMDALPER